MKHVVDGDITVFDWGKIDESYAEKEVWDLLMMNVETIRSGADFGARDKEDQLLSRSGSVQRY